jgi:hypothetical protein
MDDSTLVSIIRSHRASALGNEDGDLSDERATALNHYHGRPYGNEVEGRSQVVSRDLSEAVDWAMPALMRLFVQSGSLGDFDPLGPEDEALAKQESDYVNQVMMRDNPGFMILHDAIKDTLLLKNGYVKHWWEETEKVREAEYSGLTMDEITMMLGKIKRDGSEVEVVGQDSRMVSLPGMSGMPQMPMNAVQQIMAPQAVEVFDIRLKIKSKAGKAVWMAVPSEEVRVSKRCRGSLQDSPFTEHVTKKTRSDLIEMGMSSDFVYSLPSQNERDTQTQSLARDSTDDESETLGQSVGDRSMDELEFCESYVMVDYDGDGVAELRKVVTVADKIPPGDEWNEPIAAVPLTSFVAKRVPHRHIGESLDDELSDLQEIMTVLKRQLLDNIYRINNAEIVINESANLRDFMTSTPGGVKRIKGEAPVQGAFAPIVPSPIIGQLLPVLDFFEKGKQSRSGISFMTDMDPDVLQNSTKGAVLESFNKASQKLEMMARLLAEGVKEAVLQVHAILLRNQDKARMVQLRGKWVEVNPQEWQERTDLTVKVGLGTGNEQEKQQKLQMLTGLQGQLLQAVVGAPPAVYQRMYAMFDDVANALGFESPEKYAIAPGSQEHMQLLQEAKQAQQQQGAAGDLSKAAEIQARADMQVQGAKLQARAQVDAAEQQFKRDKAMLESRMEAADRDAERRHELLMQRIELNSQEAREAMKQEVQLMLKSMAIDLGQPGISAGVQGAAGVPMHQMPDGSMMAGGAMPPMDQQTMPPDGMAE